jgi:hypothetical protein
MILRPALNRWIKKETKMMGESLLKEHSAVTDRRVGLKMIILLQMMLKAGL